MKRWLAAAFAMLLAGCVTWHEPRPVVRGQPVVLGNDEVLIFGQVIGMPESGDHPGSHSAFARALRGEQPGQPFGLFGLQLAHLPAHPRPILAHHREGYAGIVFDFRIKSLTVDNDGYFAAVVPAGEYLLGGGQVAFDCRVPGHACYLGTLTLTTRESAPRVNRSLHPAVIVSDALPAAQRWLATVAGLDEGKIRVAGVVRLPCTFNIIGFPRRESPDGKATPSVAAGRLAIATANFAPDWFDLYTLGKSEAAKRLVPAGIAAGAVEGAIAPLSVGPFGVILYPFIAPVFVGAGAVTGGIAGSVAAAKYGLPDDDAQALAKVTTGMAESEPPAAALARRLGERAAQSGITATLLPDGGPRAAGETPDYERERKEGYASVLEISLPKAGFATVMDSDPPLLAFGMKVRVRTVGLEGERRIGERTIDFLGITRPLSAWTADDGTLLRADRQRSVEDLAQCLSEALFPASDVLPDAVPGATEQPSAARPSGQRPDGLP